MGASVTHDVMTCRYFGCDDEPHKLYSPTYDVINKYSNKWLVWSSLLEHPRATLYTSTRCCIHLCAALLFARVGT